MIKEKINICDLCIKRIANRKCEICERDCCDGCLASPYLSIKRMKLFEYPICRECSRRLNLTNIELDITQEVKDSLKKQITEQLNKAMILSALENENENE